MFVPVLILVLVAKSIHEFELLLLHVAVIVSLSESVQITYSAGVVLTSVLSLVGLSPLCVGSLFVVK